MIEPSLSLRIIQAIECVPNLQHLSLKLEGDYTRATLEDRYRAVFSQDCGLTVKSLTLSGHDWVLANILPAFKQPHLERLQLGGIHWLDFNSEVYANAVYFHGNSLKRLHLTRDKTNPSNRCIPAVRELVDITMDFPKLECLAILQLKWDSVVSSLDWVVSHCPPGLFQYHD